MAHDYDTADFDRLWDYDDPAATEAKFRQILPATRALPDHDHYCQLLTQIARAAGLQRKFDEAHRVLDEAEAVLSADMIAARMRCLLERGRVFNSAGQADRAKPLFQQAWDLARSEAQDFHAVDAAHMMAIVEKGDASLAWNEQAIALAECSQDERARNWLGSLYNNVGWAHHDRGEFVLAMECFEKALKFRQQQGNAKPIRIAKWCVARAMRSLGKISEALVAQQSLLAECAAVGESPDGYVFEEIGECLLALGREVEAAPMFAKAHALFSRDPWLAEREPARLQRLARLAGIEKPDSLTQ